MAAVSFVIFACACSFAAGEYGKFTVTSLPVELRYGEVHNKVQYDPQIGGLALPSDVVERYADGKKLMAITGFDPEMVRVHPNGEETKVLLSDHYVHHYILHFGSAKNMRQMINLTEHDKHAAQMLTGCHGMKGAGSRKHTNHMNNELSPDHSWVDFGSASGAEFRHNPQRFQAPYRLVLKKPEVWAPTLHIINTNLADNHTAAGSQDMHNAPQVSRLLECPCTPQRKIDTKAGTIDGRKPEPRIKCSKEFAATGNPSCHLSTYVGGWRCCEHGMFLIDTDKECSSPRCVEKVVDKVYMKFTFYYEDATPASREIEPSACCDVTSDTEGDENIEYDVTPCPKGTAPEDCVHIAESVQPIGYYYPGSFPGMLNGYPKGSDLVDLVFAAPHLHWAGIKMTLTDHETNETLCEVSATADNSNGISYGDGSTAGNENGYLVGLKPCSWNGTNARRFRRDHLLRARAVYNATTYHTGVMGLWLMSVSAAPDSIVV
jgi:hypothetical protein